MSSFKRFLYTLFFLVTACTTGSQIQSTATPPSSPSNETAVPSDPKLPPPTDTPEPSLTPTFEPTTTTNPFINLGQIIFIVNINDGREVYFINADGTQLTRWPYQIDEMSDLAWSPDGTRVVFTSSLDGDNEIYGMNADG